MTLAFVIVFVVYTFVVLARPAGTEFSREVGLLGKATISFVIGAWNIYDGLFRRDGSRLSWQSRRSIPVVLGLSTILMSVGDVFLSYRVLILHQTSRSTSVADYIYLSAYPLILIGLLKMPVRPIPLGNRVQTVFDGLIAMTSLVTFSWFFFLGPILESGVHSMYDRVVAAAFPCFDLLMMFCILVVSFHPAERRLQGPVWLACCAVSMSIAGNGLYLYLLAHTTLGITGVLTPIWLTGYLLLGLAGMGASRIPAARTTHLERTDELPERVLESYPRSPWLSLAPYALVPPLLFLVAFVLYHPETRRPLTNGVFAGGAVLILLIMTRQMIVLMDHRTYSRLLRDAYKELRTSQGELEAQSGLLAQANERLRQLATTDPLTGLANRRAFQDRIAEEAHGVAAGKRCGLLLLDVDNFKSYNDTYGHPAGDEVLKVVARLVRDVTPAGSLVARYGGEEFALLLPGVTYAQARAAAEAVRLRIQDHAFPDRAVTVSVGVACLDDRSGVSTSRLAANAISAADAALYRAKRAGRNRVEYSGELDGGTPP